MKIRIIIILAVFLIYSAQATAFFDWSDEDAVTGPADFSGNYSGKVSLNYEFLEEDVLKISVEADDMIVPVLGMAFHLKYPSLSLKFIKYEPGDFLERGGDPLYLVQDDQSFAAVVFGETLRRTDSFPTGKGKIADFYFQIVDGEEFEFYFDRAVVSTLDTVRQDIDRIDWVGIRVEKDDFRELKEVETISKIGSINIFERDIGIITLAVSSLFSMAVALILFKKFYRLKSLWLVKKPNRK